jgi:MinD superfamily P-loop ATPase
MKSHYFLERHDPRCLWRNDCVFCAAGVQFNVIGMNLRRQNISHEMECGHCAVCVIVGLERGPLSLVSTTEELLDRKVAAPV